MKAGKVRPLAICVFSHQRRILVAEGYDSVKKQTFYRPLGGKIEFGEPSAQTVRRELMEEIGYEVGNLHYLATLENIFTYNGQKGHEIFLIYDGDFKDPGIYQLSEIEGHEEGHETLRAVWKPLSDFQADGEETAPLYPSGLLQILQQA